MVKITLAVNNADDVPYSKVEIPILYVVYLSLLHNEISVKYKAKFSFKSSSLCLLYIDLLSEIELVYEIGPLIHQ